MSEFEKVTNIKALMPKDAKDYWLLDMASSQCSLVKEADLADSIIRAQSLIFCPDAKSLINKHKIKHSPTLRLACLSTIKKLLHKNNLHAELELPSFLKATDALHWSLQAVKKAVSKIDEWNLGLLVALECQVIPATVAMEHAGLAFDKGRWQEALRHYEAESAQLKTALEKYFQKNQGFALFGPEPIDLNNSQAVKIRLEEILGQKLASTSQSSLKNFKHEAVLLLLKYRECSRMLSTYGESFLDKIRDNRLHATFVPLGSASGRFACHDPNLQALPNDARFQACLKPSAPRKLLYFDYGGFELRILAALSEDQELIEIFNGQKDIHSMVAEAVFGVQVSKLENAHLRDQAKILNFGLIYGMGEHALARQLNMSIKNAQSLMKNYFARFPRVLEFLESLEQKAHQKGYVNTALGRRVYLSPSDSPDKLGRVARNIPIQGTGADIAKLAMCKVYSALYNHGLDAQLVNMIHDELVIECHENLSADVSTLVANAMSEAFNAVLPSIAADVSVSCY